MNFTRQILFALIFAGYVLAGAAALTVPAATRADGVGGNTGEGAVSAFVSQTCPPLALAPDSLPGGVTGVLYRQVMTVSGDAGRYQFALGNGVLPPGFGLDRDGVLAGTPAGAGTYRFTLTATNVVTGCFARSEYVLEINLPPPCPTPVVTPATLPDGALGAAYHQTVTVTGGAAPYTFSFRFGSALPPGLSFINNVLSGTPTQTGTFSFAGRVTDANGCQGVWGYTVTIKAAVTFVSAASYKDGAAPESIVAAFGAQLAAQTQTAASLPLPVELAGVRVRLRDSFGVERLAPLFFVSPNQINFQIPASTAAGPATVSLSSGATSQLEITRTAPGLFTANADGQGVPAAVLLRVRANGASLYEPVARLEGNRFAPAPLDLGPAGEQVFLVLFGTGFRFRQTVSASAGGLDANVLFAGAAAGFAGLDQVNVLLPRALAGRGDVDVTLRVDGVIANTVRVHIR